MSQITYFGQAHDAPVYQETRQVPTPVNQNCMYCGEPILLGEDGFLDSCKNPFHRECFLRILSGSVSHMMKACSCFREDAIDCEDGITLRQGAKLALEYRESRG
jgi:hypothetical protein